MELEMLMAAIRERRLILLHYDGRPRHLEAYALAKNNRNEDIFVGRQVYPWLPLEKSRQQFLMKNIYGLLVLDREFTTTDTTLHPPGELVADFQLAA